MIDLKAMRERAGEAQVLVIQSTFPPDTGHSQSCRCIDCANVWVCAERSQEARRALFPRVAQLVDDVIVLCDKVDSLRAERDEAHLNALAAVEETVKTYERETSWTAVIVKQRDEARAERDALRAEVERLREAIAIDDKIIADRDRILDAEPCPEHGRCVPHVLQTLAGQKAEIERLRDERVSLLQEVSRLSKYDPAKRYTFID